MTRFEELSRPWQRIFELEWESLCQGSRAIAAVIADAEGNIISEGRNATGETLIPNPKAAHAETEAIRGLDTGKYPDVRSYTLYAGLEPCVMCMGTLVMGGIRHVVIGASDNFGGAMSLIDLFPFAKSKGIEVVFKGGIYGEMQRAFQTLKELLYTADKDRLEIILADFSVYNAAGVAAARELFDSRLFSERKPSDFTASEIFDMLAVKIGS
ncbi:MAG: nucleoside deaminase [Ruminococcus sp.]|nr:nucleoside deaminase [Ruminococcus sp.]